MRIAWCANWYLSSIAVQKHPIEPQHEALGSQSQNVPKQHVTCLRRHTAIYSRTQSHSTEASIAAIQISRSAASILYCFTHDREGAPFGWHDPRSQTIMESLHTPTDSQQSLSSHATAARRHLVATRVAEIRLSSPITLETTAASPPRAKVFRSTGVVIDAGSNGDEPTTHIYHP